MRILRPVCFPFPVLALSYLVLTFVIDSPSESSGKSPLKPERSPENGEKNGKLSKVKESVKKHLHHSSK